jgi:hypothetical protein
MRQTLQTIAVLVIMAGLVAVGLLVAGQSGWVHKRVQEATARQLADMTGREVRVGPVSGNLFSSLEIRGISLAEERKIGDGAILSVQRVRLKYDLGAMLRRSEAPAAAVREVHIDGLDVTVERYVDGTLNLEELLPPSEKPVAPEDQFHGLVYLEGVNVHYTDRDEMFGREPLDVDLAGISGWVDLSRSGWIKAQLSAEVSGGELGYIALEGLLHPDSGQFSVDADIADLNLAWAQSRFWQNPDVAVRNGEADIKASVYNVELPESDVSFCVHADLDQTDVVVTALGSDIVRISGPVTATPHGALTDGLHLAWQGSDMDIAGSVLYLDGPTLDLQVHAPRLDSGRVLAALPEESVAELPEIALSGTVGLEASIIGTPDHAAVDARISVPGTIATDVSEHLHISAEDLDVRISLLDTANPAVFAEVDIGKLDPGTIVLGSDVGEEDESWPQTVTVSPLEDFSVRAEWARGEPLIHADIALDTASVGEVALNDIAAEAVVAGKALHLRNLRADLLGGDMHGEAVLDFSGEHPAVYSEATLSGIDLAQIEQLPQSLTKLPAVPRGTVDASIGLEYADEQLSSAMSITCEALGYEQWDVARAAALLRQKGNIIEVLTAFASDPLATVWAKGDMSMASEAPGRQLALDVQVAEAQLDELLGRLDVDDVNGVLYAQGQLRGSIEAPTVSANVAVFEPAYREYDLDAISAELVVDSDTLHLEPVMATRGRAAVSVTASLSHLSGLIADKDATDAPIAGSFDIAGVQLAEVAELFEWDNGGIDGLAEVSGMLSGTLNAPVISGTGNVAHALTSTVDITEAKIPFKFADNELAVDDAVLQVQGAELHAYGTIEFAEPPVLSARLSATDIYLEGIHHLRRYGIGISGLVQIPVARVEGPFDALVGQALVVSKKISIDNETVENLEAEATLAHNVFRLEQMNCAVGEGKLSGSGFYDAESQEIIADFTISDGSVSELLSVARPVVAGATSEGMNAEKQRRLLRSIQAASLRLDGQLTSRTYVQGTLQEPDATVTMTLTEAAFDGVDIPDVEAQAVAIREGIYDLELEAAQGDTLITASGDVEFAGDVRMLVEGSGIKLANYAKWLPLDTDLTGNLGFTIAASGQARQPQLMASVDVLEPGAAGIELDVLTAPIISIEEGKLRIDTLVMKRNEQELVVDGTLPFSWETVDLIPDQPMQLEAKAQEIDLALIPVFINEYVQHNAKREGTDATDMWEKMEVSGLINSTVKVTGTPETPSLSGFLRVGDASVALAGAKKPLHDIVVDLVFDGDADTNIVRVKQAQGVWDSTTISLDGEVEFSELGVENLHRNTYDLTAAVRAESQQFAKGGYIHGLGGTIALKGGGEEPPELTIERLGGRFGKGSIYLDGNAQMATFELADLAGNKTQMALVADNSNIVVKGLLDAMVDGTISVNGAGGGEPAQITGNWTVAHGRVTVPLAAAPEKKPMFALDSNSPKPQLDVVLALGPDMTIYAPGVSAPLEPSRKLAHLTGTPQNPVVTGLVQAQRGKTQMPGGFATIESLGLDYKLGPKLTALRYDPVELVLSGRIWGRAETVLQSAIVNGRDIGTVTIRLVIDGTLSEQMDISVASTPPLAEEQIYALLGTAPFGGVISAGNTGFDSAGQMVSRQFLSALAVGFRTAVFMPIEQELRRSLGLSELSVNFTFDQPVEIRIGKYLMEDLLVSYRTAFGSGDDEYDITVSYEFGPKLRVSYTTDERSQSRLQVEKVWDF